MTSGREREGRIKKINGTEQKRTNGGTWLRTLTLVPAACETSSKMNMP